MAFVYVPPTGNAVILSERDVMKIAKFLCYGVFLILAASAFSMPLEIPDNFYELARQVDKNKKPSMSAAAYKAGDTVYQVCSITSFGSVSGGGNDCWGWEAPDGTEYAIYGSSNAVEFYNMTTLSYVGKAQAPSCTWRDMKTYQHYCYAVSECGGTNQGLLVIDLQYLPDSVHVVGSFDTSPTGDVTSHNLSIDTIKGYAYLEGSSSANNSVRIFDLSNPENPTYVNSFGPSGGLHDIYAMNDTVYVAEGWNPTFSIWNLANKNSPQMLVRVTVPNAGYVHNIWPTDDRRHIVTTEETPGKTVKIWNIEDLQNIYMTGEYLGSSNLAHNAHLVGNKLYLSHYESGVSIVDLEDPFNPTELAVFDTYAGDNANFNGCWGVYPHTSSGQIYASNMDGVMFILSEENFVLASDTMKIISSMGSPGQDVTVDVWAKWSQELNEFDIPFYYGGPLNLKFDSITTTGHLTDYFSSKNLTVYDPFHKRMAYNIKTSQLGTLPPLPPGEGVIASLHFSVGSAVTGDTNLIYLDTVNSREPLFHTRCVTYNPDTLGGEITLFPVNCCVGIRGNIDGSEENPPDENGIDIADLVFMVDYQFRGGDAPACFDEADVNASGGIDIEDLVFMVDYSFDRPGGEPPYPCDL